MGAFLRLLVVLLFLVSSATHATFPKQTVWVTCNLGQCEALYPYWSTPLEACVNSHWAQNPEVTNIWVATEKNALGQFECYANYPGCTEQNGCPVGSSAGPKDVCPLFSSGTSDCTCNPGFLQANSFCSGGKNNACTVGNSLLGNPCNPANGNKFEQQVVYRGLNGFEFALTYNSFDTRWTRFRQNWRDTFDRRVLMDGANAVVYRQDGRVLVYTPSAGVWTTDADTNDKLVELQNPPGTRIGWELSVAATDDVESYNAVGKLVSIRSRSGLLQTLTYSDGTTGPNGGVIRNINGSLTTTPLPAGVLIRVSDHFGRTLSFAYNAALNPLFMTDPAGGLYRFEYSGGQPLTKITFPDNRVRTYVYSEVANTSGEFFPTLLTGIVDENGDRFATFQYDTQRRSIATEHAGPSFRYSISYASGATTVTDPLNAQRTYNFETVLGAYKNTEIMGAVCPACGPASQTFDANGSISSTKDWRGNKTTYVYDLSRNLETSRTEALTSTGAATPQTRTISTEWHLTFRLPIKVAEPLRLTTFVYDLDGSLCGARGALCSKTMQATSDVDGSQGLTPTVTGLPRTWSYTYNVNGHVLTVDGPRTDVSDVTTYTYYANNDSDIGKRGNLATISNALGHLTSISSYNAHGQPLTVVDENGMTTSLTYDDRQRLKTRTAGTELTSYDYDDAGQLTRVTLPDGSFLSYGYDAAHRLTSIEDNLGNRIAYSLDAMGNRTLEEIFDPASQLVQKRSRVYNALNRLFRELGALNQTTEYGYDDQGNVVSVKDPLNHTTTNEYDALNRLKKVTSPSPISAVSQYAYNGLDTLTQVTDPRNVVTGYTVDGLGNLTQQSSPGTGNTLNMQDAAGNIVTTNDAKSQTTTYVYDALNRVTLITFHDGSKQTYTYDQFTNGIGRLSSIVETNAANQVTSQLSYAYDLHGRVTSEARTINGVQYVVGYSYNSAGRLEGMTYPSGRTVTYGFDGLGRVSQITTTKNSQSQTVVQSVVYHPFGAPKGYTLGNGRVYARNVDLDGRILSYTLGAKTFAIGYDVAGRIEFISQTEPPVTPPDENRYGYDEMDRLKTAVTPTTSYGYGYDAIGNRSSRTAGTSTDTYTYSPSSNRLVSITGSSPARNFFFDPNGSTTSDGINTYAYDVRGRMMQSTSSIGATNYQVNALGQRIRKSSTLGDTVFHYDTAGRLIAESGPAGASRRELIYLGDIPVGVVQ